MMRALVVEDTPAILDTIALCLSMRWPDYTLFSAQTGREAVELATKEAVDVIILDLGLPDTDGMDVLQRIRKFSAVPILILTARNEEMSRVKELELGADDYIAKPFSHTELLARIKAVLRRSQRPDLWNDQGIIHGPDMVIDLTGRRLLLRGEAVELTPLEWNLLSCLAKNQGRVVSPRVLAEKVWGTEEIDASSIKMGIYRLRSKLGDTHRSPKLIHAHRGMGYSITLPH